MKTTILIAFVINAVVTRHHQHHRSHYHKLMNILKSKDNFFSAMNEDVQNIMNKLFEFLKLPDHFITKPNVKLLIIMLYDLNNIAGNNFDLYHLLKNVTEVEASSKAINRIRLDEMVREIINQNQLNAYNKTKHKSYENVIARASTPAFAHLTRHMQPMSEFKDSEEFKRFIGSLLRKVKSLTIDDLFKKKRSNQSQVSQMSLQEWEPPKHLKNWHNNKTSYRRIFKGRKTNVRTYPFIVSIHILQEFMCAGNIIKEDLILTAASCVQIHYNNRFFRETPKITFVRIGSDWASRRGDLVPVLEIYFYPSYDPKSMKHNIAILRLTRTIHYKTRRRAKVKRISLDHFDGYLPSNTREIVLLGWGATKKNQIVDNYEKLQVSFVEVFPMDECRTIYSKEYVTETNFCAGFFSRGGGACNRDVGGPGLVGGRLVGIVSFGPPVCGAPNAPTVFTRVGNYIDWIEAITQMIPTQLDAPTTTMMVSKAFIYQNTLSKRKVPIIHPVTGTPVSAIINGYSKINAEEKVLNEIVTDLADEKNNSLIYDIIDEAFTEDNATTTSGSNESSLLNMATLLRADDEYTPVINTTVSDDIVANTTTATASIQTDEQSVISTQENTPAYLETNMSSPQTIAEIVEPISDDNSAYITYDNFNYDPTN